MPRTLRRYSGRVTKASSERPYEIIFNKEGKSGKANILYSSSGVVTSINLTGNVTMQDLLPFLPEVSQPNVPTESKYRAFYDSHYYRTGADSGVDEFLVMLEVPANEEWMVHSMMIEHLIGNGHCDYVQVQANRKYVQPNTPLGGIGYTYIIGEILAAAFPYIIIFPSPLPLPPGTQIWLRNDFNAVADRYFLSGLYVKKETSTTGIPT